MLRSLKTNRLFSVLALESSADDTCAAIVTSNREILSNIIIKQNNLHEAFGGIHPSVAIEAHQRNMPMAIRCALKEASMDINGIDGIAYTRGPGIGGCLSVGSNAAKNIAAALNKPLVGVHHMQAHALTPFLTSQPAHIPEFPFLTLLISGGHTLLLLAHSPVSFQTLATTADESIGRAFDKVSRLLGLSWGDRGLGAALEQFCAERDDADSAGDTNLDLPALPRPMHAQLAFSYSGLHSSIERYIHSRGGLQKSDLPAKRAIARAFQKSAVLQLEEKLSLGLKWCAQRHVNVHHVIVSGGVASNTFLRERLNSCLRNVDFEPNISLVFPPPHLCTDNAAMIAWTSMHRFLAQDHDDYAIELRAKWNIEDLAK